MRLVFRNEKRLSIAAFVPDIARAAHRAGDAVIGHQPLERLVGILAMVSTMEDLLCAEAAFREMFAVDRSSGDG